MSAITILDGGMGKELRRIGAPFRQPEWSALALLEAPDLVTRAHRNFIEAGADVLITNTYAVVPFHIGDERFAGRGRELVEVAARLARDAADGAGRPVRVAGSLPPVCGSYVPDDFDPTVAPLRWQVLIEPQAPYVDLWIGETISSTGEARVLLETLAGTSGEHRAEGSRVKPAWLAFTLDDTPGHREATLRSGEPMSAIVDLLADPVASAVEAVLFNCSQPEVIRPALTAIRNLLPKVTLGAYANAFADHHAGSDDYAANEHVLERRDDLTAERYADLAAEWVEAGATIVGGCCDIYPEHIGTLAARFGGQSTADAS